MHDNEFEARLTRALETPPAVYIPANFAARVAQQVGAEKPAIARLSLSAGRFGPLAIKVAVVILLLAMLLTARVATGALPLTLEFILATEFIALTLWLGLHPESL